MHPVKWSFPRNWWKIGLLWMVLFLAIYGLAALEGRQKNRDWKIRRTTYSVSSGGYKALYLWLKRLGLPVQRWEKSYHELPTGKDVLLVAEPEMGLGKGELKGLLKWVNGGGNLVLVTSFPNTFLNQKRLKAEILKQDNNKTMTTTTLHFQPGPYTQNVHDVRSLRHPALIPQSPEVVIHMRDVNGGLLAVFQKGKGRVMVMTDSSLFDNQSLRKADHARLALNLLLAHLGEGTILVDEFHHGYGRATSVLDHMMRSRVFESLLQALLVLLMIWLAFAKRFSPARPQVQVDQRSSMEYIQAMASIFQRGRARTLALTSNLHWIEEEAKRYFIDRDETFKNTVQSVRDCISKEDMDDNRLLHQVNRLYRSLKEAKQRAAGS